MSSKDDTLLEGVIAAAATLQQCCWTEHHFVDNNQCMKVLVVMCRGLINEDSGLPLHKNSPGSSSR